MKYYQVLVSSNHYHGTDALTYESMQDLIVGSIVSVSLRRTAVPAIVLSEVPKPSFKTKAIDGMLTDAILPAQSIELLQWMASYYPAPSGVLVSQFIPKSLLQKSRRPDDGIIKLSPVPLPTPTMAQQTAIDTIMSKPKGSFLVHGVTGSGKTRIYQDIAQAELKAGKNVIVLVPEIGLTTQLQKNFLHLGFNTLVFHSNLTLAKRRDIWLSCIHVNKPTIVIGPRSALFLPLSNIGAIIIDESHDNSYKQDQLPRYHASRVAAKLADIHSARLIMGTATPPVSDYHLLSTKKLPIISLPEVAIASQYTVKTSTVDASERSLFTRNPYVSDPVIESIESSLQRKEQSLVFINRRGTARLMICQNGDWQATCPNCELPLTYHNDTHQLRCHTCGYKDFPQTSCPECGNPDIILRSPGTKAIVEILNTLFPDAIIKRYDTDNKKDEKIEHQYSAIRRGEVDILVGTQIIAKGLDLPKLSLVAILSADASLNLPDYTSEEQTYQLLSQVMGRVGRGHRNSSIIIQTHNASSAPVRAAIDRDWSTFYNHQLTERKAHHLPPYYFLLKISFRHKSLATTSKSLLTLKDILQRQHNNLIEIIGPAPHFHEKQSDAYNWHLVIKAKQRTILTDIVQNLPSKFSYDLDPLNLL